MVGRALNVHAPQCRSRTERPERPDWGRVHGGTTCLGEAASTWHSVLPFALRRHPVSLGQDQRRISMPSARLDWLIGSGWAASAVRVHGVGRPKPPICRSVWLNVARTMSIMVVDPVRRPLGCSIPALLLVLTTASLQRFHSRSLVAIYRPLLRHQGQLCQESHTRSLNRCSLLDDLETTFDHFGSGRAVVHSMALFFVEISGCMEPGIKERAQVLAIPAQVLRQGSPFAQSVRQP